MWNFLSALRIRHPETPQQVHYVQGRILSNGAQTLAYETRYTRNPVFLFRGAGRNAGQFRVTQHPQVYYHKAVPTNGIGGVQTGSMYGQSLTNADLSPVE